MMLMKTEQNRDQKRPVSSRVDYEGVCCVAFALYTNQPRRRDFRARKKRRREGIGRAEQYAVLIRGAMYVGKKEVNSGPVGEFK